ncbi:hypothetical protein AB3N60_05215 [Leptospira sp. WS39.C2]
MIFQKKSIITISVSLLILFLITFFCMSCRDTSTDSLWVPLSLITIARDAEE